MTATMHAFCLNPLHPGPCKGWKGTPPAKATAAKAAPPAATPKPAAPQKRAVKAAPAAKVKLLNRAQGTALQEQMLAADPWTDEQQDALHDYSGDEYVYMNAALRGVKPQENGHELTDPDPEATGSRIAAAAAALRPLPQAVRVFRNVDSATGLGLGKSYSRRELLPKLRELVGQRRQERGFSSTATKRTSEDHFGDVQLEIEVPEGTPGAFINGVSQNVREDELLLAPGAHYEFVSLDETKKMPVLKVRLIRP